MPLSEQDAARWRKDLADWSRAGPELGGESGEILSFELPGGGRAEYVLGGEQKRPKGVLIGLHGGGGTGDRAQNAWKQWDSPAKSEDLAGVFPQLPPGSSWASEEAEELVVALLEAALRTWRLDPDLSIIGGQSMGSAGAWWIGGRNADRFRALCCSSGGPPGQNGARPDPVNLANLRQPFVVLFHSQDDGIMPVGGTRSASAKLDELARRFGGFRHEYWEVERNGHSAPPGGMERLLERIPRGAREPVPAKLVWEPGAGSDPQFHWLWWDPACPAPDGTLLVAEADREKNTIRLELEGRPLGLSILLDDRLVDLDRELVVTRGADEVWRGRLERSLEVLARTSRRVDPQLAFEAQIEIPGE